MEASSFARSLRNSKAIRHQVKGVPVVLTTPPQWRNSDEYGMKAPLPKARRRTPFIYLQESEGPLARPEWRSAAQDAQFAQKWEESGLGASPATEDSQGLFLATSQFDPISVPTVDGLEGIAQSAKRRKSPAPDFTWLSERDFEDYLQRIRELRPAFQKFCEEEAARLESERMDIEPADGSAVASTSKAVDLFDVASQGGDRGRLIIAFLNRHADDLTRSTTNDLKPYPHPVLGLQYAPPSTLHNTRFAEPIPARLLSKTFSSKSDGLVSPSIAEMLSERAPKSPNWAASALGVIATLPATSQTDRTGTEWLPDSTTGYRDNNAGKGHYRLESATAEVTVAPKARDRRAASESPWLYETVLDNFGGHRAVRPTTGTRELQNHPGVPEMPVQLTLRAVDTQAAEKAATPGSAAWVTDKRNTRDDAINRVSYFTQWLP